MVAHLYTIVAHLMVVPPPMVDVVATFLSAALAMVVVTEISLPPEVATDLNLLAQATADRPMVAQAEDTEKTVYNNNMSI